MKSLLLMIVLKTILMMFLENYLTQYPHLKISNVNKDPKFTHNKKFAQFIGIKAAKNEILLFTDADCKPDSR